MGGAVVAKEASEVTLEATLILEAIRFGGLAASIETDGTILILIHGKLYSLSVREESMESNPENKSAGFPYRSTVK
jgi:hypothetical protein